MRVVRAWRTRGGHGGVLYGRGWSILDGFLGLLDKQDWWEVGEECVWKRTCECECECKYEEALWRNVMQNRWEGKGSERGRDLDVEESGLGINSCAPGLLGAKIFLRCFGSRGICEPSGQRARWCDCTNSSRAKNLFVAPIGLSDLISRSTVEIECEYGIWICRENGRKPYILMSAMSSEDPMLFSTRQPGSVSRVGFCPHDFESGRWDVPAGPSRTQWYLSWLISSSSSFFLLDVPLSSSATVIAVDPVEGFHHDHRVSTDHAHAQPHLFVVRLALGGFVEDDVEEDLSSPSF